MLPDGGNRAVGAFRAAGEALPRRTPRREFSVKAAAAALCRNRGASREFAPFAALPKPVRAIVWPRRCRGVFPASHRSGWSLPVCVPLGFQAMNRWPEMDWQAVLPSWRRPMRDFLKKSSREEAFGAFRQAVCACVRGFPERNLRLGESCPEGPFRARRVAIAGVLCGAARRFVRKQWL